MRVGLRVALLITLISLSYAVTLEAVASPETPTYTTPITASPQPLVLVPFARTLNTSYDDLVNAWFSSSKLVLVVRRSEIALLNVETGPWYSLKLPSAVQSVSSGGNPATAVCVALRDGSLSVVRVTPRGFLDVMRVDVLKQVAQGRHAVECDQVKSVVAVIDRVLTPEGLDLGVLYLYRAPSLGRVELGATPFASPVYRELGNLLGTPLVSVEGVVFELEPLRTGGYAKSSSRMAIEILGVGESKASASEAVALLAFNSMEGSLRLLSVHRIRGKLLDFSLVLLDAIHVLPMLLDVNGTLILKVLYLKEVLGGAQTVAVYEDVIGPVKSLPVLYVYPLQGKVLIGVDTGDRLLLYMAKTSGLFYATGLAYYSLGLGMLRPFSLFVCEDSPYVIYAYSSTLNVYSIERGRPLWVDYEGVPIPTLTEKRGVGITVSPDATYAVVFTSAGTVALDLKPTLQGVSRIAVKVEVGAEGEKFTVESTITVSCVEGAWKGVSKTLEAPRRGFVLYLPLGAYEVKACREPYGCSSTRVEVEEATYTRIVLEMRAATFSFCVRSPGDPQGLGFGKGPVEGAVVEVLDSATGRLVAQGKTDGSGCWRALLGVGRTYRVRVYAPDFEQATLEKVEMPSLYTVELKPLLAKLSVKVVDLLSGSELKAKVAVISQHARAYLEAPFELDLPPGNYTLKVSCSNYASQVKVVSLGPGERKYVIASLKPAEYEVMVVVREPQGAPVAGATVVVEGTAFNGARVVREASTGPDGVAKFMLVSGSYRVSVKAPDHEAGKAFFRVPSQKLITVTLKLTPTAAVVRQLLGFVHGYAVYILALAIAAVGGVVAYFLAKKVRARRPRREAPLEELLGI